MSHKNIFDLDSLVNISNQDFDSLNLEFEFELTNPYIIKKFYSLNFKNCIFNTVKIENITNEDFDITFLNCIFKATVDINKNKIKNLDIIWHKKDISFNASCEKFSISSNVFGGRFKLKHLLFQKGNFQFIGNIFKKVPRIIHPIRETKYNICEISNCEILNGSFHSNTFYMPFNFKNNILKYNAKYSGHTFINNIFQKSYFSNSNFGNNAEFRDCDFLGTTLFDNINSTKQEFNSCKFTGYTHFSNSKILNLSIQYSSFDKPVSFREAEFENIKLSDVKFEKGAYFDDIKIKNVENGSYIKTNNTYSIKEWKHTLRIIKQELQKTENKIDFNRFRNYELAVHYKELNLFKNFKDTSILWATKWSSNFGNWFWSLGFTILSGLFWYMILYRIENSGTFNYEKTNEFFVGAFRFFLVTDFYNPLENDRTYLENGWSWLIFILGKIFIAFGIYEMIQSFRKFKA
jgi:hypothetical protein